jgi:hypothetical protein
MAKITGRLQTLTLATNAITCITSVDYSDTADEYLAACSGATTKVHITGQRNITATVNVLLDSAANTQLGYFDPGDASAWVHGFTATGTDTEIIASNAVVKSRTISAPVEGLIAASFVVGLDDITIQTVAN